MLPVAGSPVIAAYAPRGLTKRAAKCRIFNIKEEGVAPRPRRDSSMETSDKLRKLSRLELVKLIYELRKDNLALQERCRKAETRVAQLERGSARGELEGRLYALERILYDVKDHMDDVSGQKAEEAGDGHGE